MPDHRQADTLAVLYDVAAFLRLLARSTLPLDEDFPIREFDDVKAKVDALLYPLGEPDA